MPSHPRSLVRRAACTALFATLMGSAVASEADRGRELLDAFLNDVSSLDARFEQSLVDSQDVVIESSRGTVQIRRPGQFRWTYDEPYVQVLVADGLNVWSYDVDLEQVTVKAQAEVLANTPAILLSGTRNVEDEFEYVESFEERGTIWVRLRPKNTDNGFSEVELGFDEGVLRRMIFADSLEQTTLIALLDVKVNRDLDDDQFRFVVPAGADLIGEPAHAESRIP